MNPDTLWFVSGICKLLTDNNRIESHVSKVYVGDISTPYTYYDNVPFLPDPDTAKFEAIVTYYVAQVIKADPDVYSIDQDHEQEQGI